MLKNEAAECSLDLHVYHRPLPSGRERGLGCTQSSVLVFVPAPVSYKEIPIFSPHTHHSISFSLFFSFYVSYYRFSTGMETTYAGGGGNGWYIRGKL